MAERLALVIGSECEDLPALRFTGQLASQLYAALMAEGEWLPVAGDGPLLNPTVAEMKTAIKMAFRVAGRLDATLLIAFIGHGVSTLGDFYLLARDSPGAPSADNLLDSDNSIHLVTIVKEQYVNAQALDGLVMLIDSCEAGHGVVGAGQRWVEVLENSGGRMELLVASGAGNAYDGCFTRTMLGTFEIGLRNSGTNLLCADLMPEIASACTWQTPRHVSFNGAQASRGDRGLWVVPNRARNRDAVRGRPASGLVDQLLHTLSLTASVRETLLEMVESGADRLQAVVGPAGSGKSTMLCLLIRPSLVDVLDFLTPQYMTAAVFLDVSSTVETLIGEVSAQLAARFGPRFDAERQGVLDELTDRDRFDAFEIEIVRVLHRLRGVGRIRVVVDGLDQPEAGGRDGIITAVSILTTDERLRHVSVVVGIRSGTGVETRAELAHARVFSIRPPTSDEVLHELGFGAYRQWSAEAMDTLGGGWLVPRLITEIDWSVAAEPSPPGDLHTLVRYRFHTTVRRPLHAGVAGELAVLLAAVGVGPVAPIALLLLALEKLGRPVALPHLRSILVDLGILIVRGRPGQVGERIGLAHTAFAGPLADAATATGATVLTAAHAVLAAALADLTGPDIDAYAHTAAPRHYLACGNPIQAIEFLDRADARRRAIDNHRSWTGWIIAFEDALRPDDPHLVTARARLARWTGDAGDPHAARDMFTALVDHCTRTFGPEHRVTLFPRVQLANWIAYLGDPRQAVAMLTELLPLQLSESEPDSHDVLRIRADLGFWTGQTGDIIGACQQYNAFLPDLERVLGPTHEDVLRSRDQYARFVGLTGDIDEAIRICTELVPLCVRELGPDNTETLWAQSNLAWWIGMSGDIEGAAQLTRHVIATSESALGAEHPVTIIIRKNLANWYGMAGDFAAARDLYADLLEVNTRLYGAENGDTLGAREALADATGQAGDATAALDQYARLAEVLERVSGRDHPDTMKAFTAVEYWAEAVAVTETPPAAD